MALEKLAIHMQENETGSVLWVCHQNDLDIKDLNIRSRNTQSAGRQRRENTSKCRYLGKDFWTELDKCKKQYQELTNSIILRIFYPAM